MKNILRVLFALLVVSFVLTSCGGSPAKQAADDACNCMTKALENVKEGDEASAAKVMEDVMKCKEEFETKYAKQLEDENFKKEFEEASKECGKKLQEKMEKLMK